MPNLKIEKENDTVLFALWHTNCFLFVGVSAAVADSLQRHATRLLLTSRLKSINIMSNFKFEKYVSKKRNWF